MTNDVKITSLNFSRKISEYICFDVEKVKIKIKKYDTDTGLFNLVIQEPDVKTFEHALPIGKVFQPLESVSLNIVGFSLRTGVIDFKVTAPKTTVIRKRMNNNAV